MTDLPIVKNSAETSPNCDGCGACCMAIGHPQFYRHSNDPIWESLPDNLKRQINEHIDNLTEVDMGEPCIWLDMETRQCKNYEYRPQMCRDFELGNPHCLRMREARGID